MTTISRRGFLGVFGAAAVGAVLDPERLLWVPGQKTIFLPSVVPAPSNTFLTIDQITREALEVLRRQLVLSDRISREYGDPFDVTGHETGTAIMMRVPKRYPIVISP